MDKVDEFWLDYIEAGDDIQRLNLINKLPLEKDENGFYVCMTTGLFNSYLEDFLRDSCTACPHQGYH